MRHIVVISTGGTIASRWQGDGYAAEAAGREVLAAGAVPEDVHVTVMDLFTVNSSRLTTAHQLLLLHTVHEVLADPAVDGVVVTHGTDTLEESAFFLDLFHTDRRPVVFTGAQKPLDAEDGDAAGNLYDALLTAATGRDIGAVIVFAGQVFAARGTVKRHTLDARAFGDPDGLPLGRVEFGRVSWGRRRPRPAALPLPPADAPTPRVDILVHHSDGDAVLFRARSGRGGAGCGGGRDRRGERQPGGRRRRRRSDRGGGAGGRQLPGRGGFRGADLHRRGRRRPGGRRRGAGRNTPSRPGAHRAPRGAAGHAARR